ncbi:hypothetical protein [uncultured Shewanella sp.]|uniref:hypothetical protein n=1 Tax=uncultured Shewanella sp. TaxID=173975 RepID=UPI002605B1E6|nr:hypothetical protein [uncultured Shewanella sp.]
MPIANIALNLGLSILFITSSAIASPVNVSGRWVGVNYTSKIKGPTHVTMTFNQTNKMVTGKYLSATGVAKEGKGMKNSPTNFKIRWKNTAPTCPGKYIYEYSLKGEQLTWLFVGEDCLGIEKGHGYAKREP